MKVGILTSSRADFGIYVPLLIELQKDGFFEIQIIAFGTHLSENHGYTLHEIEEAGFDQIHKIKSMPSGDSSAAIAASMGETLGLFSKFWNEHSFDLVFALGDRFEMFAAVSAASPFGIQIAHLHAGETTLGAIDNGYRHAISLFSKYLFVSTEAYKERAKEIVGNEVAIYNVGALSIDNLNEIDFLTTNKFLTKFKIDLSLPTVLSTFHPETIDFQRNKDYVRELILAFEKIMDEYQILITLPNADTMGAVIREELLKFGEKHQKVKIVESLGMHGYLSAMKHSAFLLGNSSSGFVEASFFPKFVINLGKRQEGRIESSNIFTVPFKVEEILNAVAHFKSLKKLDGTKVYGKGNTAHKIVKILKNMYD